MTENIENIESADEIVEPVGPKFKRGDKVLVNGMLADIENYDESADRVVFVTYPAGGGTDTTTAHISNTKLDKVPTLDTEAIIDGDPWTDEPIFELADEDPESEDSDES